MMSRYAPTSSKIRTLGVLALGIIAVFALRTWLARTGGDPPRLFALWNGIVIVASAAYVLAGRRVHVGDVVFSLGLGALMGALLPYAPSYYPLVEADPGRLELPAHAAALAVCTLAGLAIMRVKSTPGREDALSALSEADTVLPGKQGKLFFAGLPAPGRTISRVGGPVRLRAALGQWGRSAAGLIWGAVLGLPLAVLNVLALRATTGQAFDWRGGPWQAALGAWQPGVVEEVVYRLALLGLFWVALRQSWGARAVGLAATLSVVVHTYAHLDDLWRDNPLFALAYGAVVGVVWGAPMAWLAVRRDLETAVGFHWMQDFLRFWAGL